MANFSTHKKRGDRGLSRLQRSILSLVRKKGGAVLARDVLVEYYGFTPYRSLEGIPAGCLVFRKSAIVGYSSATVGVCKAFNRLVKRGLAARRLGGVQVKIN